MPRGTGTEEQIAVVGAGLCGCAAAVMLAKRGYHVDLFEGREDLRKTEGAAGRSINLALSARGLSALEIVGIADEIKEGCIPMYARYIHNSNGSTSIQPYGKPDQCILSVDRRKLNEALLDACEAEPNIDMHFKYKCESVSLRQGNVLKFVDNNGERVVHRPELIVGCDGAYSVIRSQLQKTVHFDFEQRYIEHGYKELVMPPTADGDYAMPSNHLHIWPRGTFMMIALPNPDKSFTVTLFMPYRCPEGGFDAITNREECQAFFEEYFPDSIPLMPGYLDDFFANPTGALATVRCNRYHHNDQVVIMGDAAHAMVPFYGQGMNAALQDTRVFHDLLDEYDLRRDTGALLQRFSELQVPNGHTICDLAMYNYVEMRAHTASKLFVWRSRFEAFLHRIAPSSFIPLYTMVSFTTIPYSEVQQRREAQDKALNRFFLFVGLSLIVLLLWLLRAFVWRA